MCTDFEFLKGGSCWDWKEEKLSQELRRCSVCFFQRNVSNLNHFEVYGNIKFRSDTWFKQENDDLRKRRWSVHLNSCEELFFFAKFIGFLFQTLLFTTQSYGHFGSSYYFFMLNDEWCTKVSSLWVIRNYYQQKFVTDWVL